MLQQQSLKNQKVLRFILEGRKKMSVKRFNKVCKRVFILSTIGFIIGMTYCNSLEATINVSTNKLSKEIEVLEGDIDGLNMEVTNLTEFKKISKVATSKGYEYETTSQMAVVSQNK